MYNKNNNNNNNKLVPLLRVFIITLFIVMTNSACPNSRSGHGDCQFNSICSCYDGWNVVSDCSVPSILSKFLFIYFFYFFI